MLAQCCFYYSINCVITNGIYIICFIFYNLIKILISFYKTYLSPRLATIENTFCSCVQYKILNNIIFLNKKLYTPGITNTAVGLFCNTLEETPIHIFIWERLQKKFRKWYPTIMYTTDSHSWPA